MIITRVIIVEEGRLDPFIGTKLSYTESHKWSIKFSIVYTGQQWLFKVSGREHSHLEMEPGTFSMQANPHLQPTFLYLK